MVKHMKLMGVAGAILLVVAGAAVASNMGFKFTANIATADPDIYDISIPLNNNYTSLQAIFDDINASAGCAAAGVTIFSPDQSTCAWIGAGSCNAPYLPGQGIRVSTLGPCTAWVIVGSHNPSFIYNFALADPNIYDIALPYHTTRTTTETLFNEIPNCAAVTKFAPDQSTCAWIGAGSCNTAIAIGDAYRVSVLAPSSWTPSHY